MLTSSRLLFLLCALLPVAQADTQFLVDLRAQTGADEALNAAPTQRVLDHNGWGFALLSSRIDWTDEWSTQLNAFALPDGERRNGVSEAYVQWQPLSSNRWQSRFRFGSYFPATSVENTGKGWLSPWTISFSAINSWLAEEVRNNGIEYALRFDSQLLEINYQWELSVAALMHNDVAGAALAWRGFRLTDRISVWNDELTLPPLPSREASAPFNEQADTLTPFRENDDKVGYQLQFVWRRDDTQLQFSRWQNNAKPTQLIDGQYGWDTQFDQFTLKTFLFQDVFLGAQYLRGHTLMGMGNFTSVDVDFDSHFVLLGWQGVRNQWAFRLDQFNVSDNDQTVNDNNAQDGDALTLSWRYNWSKAFSTQIEWQRVDSDRPARVYAGLAREQLETLWQLALKWRL